MNTKTKNSAKSMCPKCTLMSLIMLPEDKAFNNNRLAEIKEIRKIGEEFKFNFKYTCMMCGPIFVTRTVKRKQ